MLQLVILFPQLGLAFIFRLVFDHNLVMKVTLSLFGFMYGILQFLLKFVNRGLSKKQLV